MNQKGREEETNYNSKSKRASREHEFKSDSNLKIEVRHKLSPGTLVTSCVLKSTLQQINTVNITNFK